MTIVGQHFPPKFFTKIVSTAIQNTKEIVVRITYGKISKIYYSKQSVLPKHHVV